MAAATGTDAAIINKQTQDIEDLTKQLGDLKSSSQARPLPLKAPFPYKTSDGSFYAYADKLLNYFKAMQIQSEARAQLLPNFLAAKEFELVTRIHNTESFSEEDLTWETAVANIVEVLQHDMTVAGALSKLQKIKQGQKSISQFVSEIERLGKRAFPEKGMADAFDRACIAALQTNCRSKVLSMEIYRAVKQAEHAKNGLTFPEVAKLAMETDAVLIENSDSDDESGPPKRHILNIHKDVQGNSARTQTKLCFECNSPEHLVRNCPNVQPPDRDMNHTYFPPRKSSYNNHPYSDSSNCAPYNNNGYNSPERNRPWNREDDSCNRYKNNRNWEQENSPNQSTSIWRTVNMVEKECDEISPDQASSLKFIPLEGPTSKCSGNLL